jgi:heat shock protein HspQ
VSEQNLVPDESGDPVSHPQIDEMFVRNEKGEYRLRNKLMAC